MNLIEKTGIFLKEYNLVNHNVEGTAIINENNQSVPFTLELNGFNEIELKGVLIITDDDGRNDYEFTIRVDNFDIMLLYDDDDYFINEKDLTKAKEYQVISYCINDFLASSINLLSYYNDDVGSYVVEVDNKLMLGTGLLRSTKNTFKFNSKHYEICLNEWVITQLSDVEHPHHVTTISLLKNLALLL